MKVRSGSGEGQEGQSQAKSSSENSKLKDLDLSHTLNLVFRGFDLDLNQDLTIFKTHTCCTLYIQIFSTQNLHGEYWHRVII